MSTINNIVLYLSEFQEKNLSADILFYFAIVCFSVQILFYLIFYIPFIFRRKRVLQENEEPVSIIICAKNEEENLRNNLPKILEQDYSKYEVIVVNDGSLDNTEELLGELREKYKNLRFTSIPDDQKFNRGKKIALTVGIKAASHENLIFTDADCYPKSKNWIKTIQHNFNDDKHIILGYGAYETIKGFLNKLIRFDTMYIALQYFSFAYIGIPYMGVGRNLAYKKSIFFKNKGFASHSHILSGDDDLFVNEVANSKNTTIELSNEAHTMSKPEPTWKMWVKQKKRHLSTGRHYRFIHKFLLVLEPFTRISFYISALIVLLLGMHIELLAVLLVFKVSLLLVITKLVMKQLDEKGLWFFSIFFDIALPLIHLYFIFSNYLLRKNNKWK